MLCTGTRYRYQYNYEAGDSDQRKTNTMHKCPMVVCITEQTLDDDDDGDDDDNDCAFVL